MDVKELLSLPLFLGMNRDELDLVQENFAIVKGHVKRNTTIVADGDVCRGLTIVTEGMVECTTRSDDNSYVMEERLAAPLVIQPERVFGLHQRHSSTFRTLTRCKIMTIDKPMVIKLSEMSLTFRINLLNMVTTQAQRLVRQHWHQQSEKIEQRIIRFIKDHSIHPAGVKVLHIHMMVFARELGCSRLEISEALHCLQDKSLIKIRRGGVEVPMLQLLLKEI